MLKINGVLIKTPSQASLESYNLTKSGRVATGKMMMDLIAKKKKINVAYESISAADMKVIEAAIDGTAMFFKVEYDLPEGYGTITCYSGAIKKQYYRRRGGWYWKDVAFALIEQ